MREAVFFLLGAAIIFLILRRRNPDSVKEFQKELERLKVFFSLVAKQYVAAYYVNIDTLKYFVYHETEGAHKSFFNADDYLESINRYIDTDVHPDDREAMKKAVSPEYIRQQLEAKEEYSVLLRDIHDGAERYYMFQVFRGNDKNHAAFIFQNKDNEIRREKRQKLVNSILSDDYDTGLYYFNAKTWECEVLSISEKIQQDTGNLIKSSASLFEVFDKFVRMAVHPDDQHKLLGQLTPEKVVANLKDRKRYSIIFRRNYSGVYKYTQLTVAKAEEEKENPVNIAVGFSEIDMRYKAEQEQKEHIERIMCLTDNIETIYDVNMDTAAFTVSTRSGREPDEYVESYAAYSDFFLSCANTIPRIIFSDDVEMMLSRMTREYMLGRLLKEPSYTLEYRHAHSGGSQWYSMKVARAGNWPLEHRMVIGIARKNILFA